MKKYENVKQPLPSVTAGEKVKIGRFTKFAKGGNLYFWLNVIREELISSNVSNEKAYLYVPQLIKAKSQ